MLVSSSIAAQTIQTLGQLPAVLEENSGMALYGNNIFYFINDGGNPASIYRYDTTTKVLIEKKIANASNVDWEDLAKDNDGNLFIGDIGNNNNNRTNLVIYKVGNPELASDSLIADTIRFSYENQTAFPPAASQLNFDCEAMIWFQDSLYLFTKNRTDPFNGWCYRYVLPDESGTYIARLLDSFQFPGSAKEFEWITAADYSFTGKELILLSSGKMHLFESAGLGSDFFSGTHTSFDFGHFSQKEAIAFSLDIQSNVYVSDEKLIVGPNLYLASTARIPGSVKNHYPFKLILNEYAFEIKEASQYNLLIVRDVSGKIVLETDFNKDFSSSDMPFAKATYFVEVVSNHKSFAFKWIKTR